VPTTPPSAERRPHDRTVHGETVTDDFHWLRDRDDPEVIAYLEAENAYTEAVLAPTSALRDELFEAIRRRTQETDVSVPVRKGPWWYYTRTYEGLQYGVHCRRPVGTAEDDEGAEQVLLDENEMAKGLDYFRLGAFSVSPDHTMLAYGTDTTGGEVFTLRVRDLATGEDHADEITGAYYGATWANDNRSIFYTTLDAAHRPWRVWRHVLGAPVDEDDCLLEEPDERFWVSVGKTRSQRFVVVGLESKMTSEVHVLDADDPGARFRVVAERETGVQYDVDHQADRDRFVITTNADGAVDFKLVAAPVDAPGRSSWEDLIPHRDDVKLDEVACFAGHLVASERHQGMQRLRVLDPDGAEVRAVTHPEPVHSVWLEQNPEYEVDAVRYGYTSLVTPRSVYEHRFDGGEDTLVKRQPVLGGFDPDDYETWREWATADDGTRIPISLVRRRDGAGDGPAPCLLYGYGSYEISTDPVFSIPRLNLVDRGVAFAIAHVRGGGEMGRRWYEQGKFLAKRNTFTDFVACARHLVDIGFTSPDRLVARGGSAGGLLMGAVVNLAPELFRAVVAEVPFVDVINTMLDETIPLTVVEFEEWGNPKDPEFYEAMKAYAPYENVEPKAYPAMLVTAGLNDPRVQYWEPAKWVARLRATKTDDRPLLLRTEMGSGHAGPSGRYDLWREEAETQAFVLWQLGLA
jgi:oligopeptidase B